MRDERRDDAPFASRVHTAFESTTAEARIADVAPTLLYLHGLPILDEMDGSVREDVISAETNERLDLDSVSAGSFERHDVVGSDRDDDAVEERLEDLGYL